MDLLLDDEGALSLATPFKMGTGLPLAADPCPHIQPSLLSADHIIEYVENTGMIAPFDGRNDEKSPLKAASYESRIGDHAYIFPKGVNYPETIFDGTQDFLEVPANSIVFVESDVYFRLPPFIAVRFNLQINHVHRGLLLGTGPLVDPGFWGRLCIPLHNLTNEPYLIPRHEGLIWIEFTKTSSTPVHGRPPSNTEFPNIKKFIEKASKPYFPDAPPIPIRSSIPDMVEEATKKSSDAASAAQRSAVEASSAKSDAAKALEQIDKIRNYNFYAMIAAALAILAICVSFAVVLINLSNRNEDIAEKLTEKTEVLGRSIQNHISEVDTFGTRQVEQNSSVPFLRSNVESQDREIVVLKAQVRKLKSEVGRIRPCDANRPNIKCP